MSDQVTKRKYELRRRAQAMADTRLRITVAAMELHGTVGPARTTLSAVAERAGVQRHTVYRHFPTETELFTACSGHYMAANPLPDATPWERIEDPGERLAVALDEMYRWFARNEAMLTNLSRDVALVEALQPQFAAFMGAFEALVRTVASAWPARGARRRLVDAAVHHVLDFRTWTSLVRDGGVSRPQAVRLGCALVASAAAGAPHTSRP
ncbi:MAG: hypothetical protein QOF17_1028 [Solirubrobacteraceae bacterium]|jgi:AcrR family transcriptional regulator|nr:hypothetical protein [Solirubrobacteraceae bacterium]